MGLEMFGWWWRMLVEHRVLHRFPLGYHFKSHKKLKWTTESKTKHTQKHIPFFNFN